MASPLVLSPASATDKPLSVAKLTSPALPPRAWETDAPIRTGALGAESAGYALAYARECMANTNFQLSAAFLNDVRPVDANDVAVPADPAYLRDACRVLAEIGVPPEADYPTLDAPSKKVADIAYMQARSRRAAGALRIDSFYRVASAAEAKAALGELGPVIVVVALGPTQAKQAMCVDSVSEDQTTFRARNSMGPTWSVTDGVKGNGYYNFSNWAGVVLEAWALRPPSRQLPLPLPGATLQDDDDILRSKEDKADIQLIVANVVFCALLGAALGGLLWWLWRKREVDMLF
jgi:hypothetical protein